MKIISLNLNGFNDAADKGLLTYLAGEQADVICLQNTYLSLAQAAAQDYQLDGYFMYAAEALTPELGGSVIYCKNAPKVVINNLGFSLADDFGRFLQVDFDKISVVSLCLPQGLNELELNAKFKLMDDLLVYFDKQKRKRRDYIYCASLYISHQKIDLFDWRTSKQSAGFLPPERAWLDEIIRGIGYLDVLREVNREAQQFSYFADSEQAKLLNLGYRFDYQLATQGLRRIISNAYFDSNHIFGHHAPLIGEYLWHLS